MHLSIVIYYLLYVLFYCLIDIFIITIIFTISIMIEINYNYRLGIELSQQSFEILEDRRILKQSYNLTFSPMSIPMNQTPVDLG